MKGSAPPSPLVALWRGVRRRCPACGAGPQFRRWFTLHERCPACSLVYEPRPGDTWLFWILGDRLFIAVTMVLLYIGLTPRTSWGIGLFLVAVITGTIATMPHRQGVCTAIDYLLRRRSARRDAPDSGVGQRRGDA